jgi:hypothetical protein
MVYYLKTANKFTKTKPNFSQDGFGKVILHVMVPQRKDVSEVRWASKLLLEARKIRNILGSFCYRKSANFLSQFANRKSANFHV